MCWNTYKGYGIAKRVDLSPIFFTHTFSFSLSLPTFPATAADPAGTAASPFSAPVAIVDVHASTISTVYGQFILRIILTFTAVKNGHWNE